MKIKKVYISNFRNFKKVDVEIGDQVVIVGENKVGKSNFLHALRLILDPSIPDSVRQLSESDFWDGLPRPLTKEDSIKISIDLVDFDNNIDLLAVLGEHLVSSDPLSARLTYVFEPNPLLDRDPKNDSEYDFLVYGGDRRENRFGHEVRKRIPFDILHALRDAEGDLSSWRKSPLRPLLEYAISKIDRDEIKIIADELNEATSSLRKLDEIEELSEKINDRLIEMVGVSHTVKSVLGFSPTDSDKLFRSLKLFIDGGKRGISEASLGSANLLYLALKSLELNQLVEQNNRDHTFLAIEEPEAHIHPHLQRLIYRYLLHVETSSTKDDSTITKHITTILTTHSPHIVSISPLKSIVLLKQTVDSGTEVVSTTTIDFEDYEIDDIERYLDVTRGEIMFAKAILLVEGDTEKFIIPTISKILELDLDELGISVCSVSGTNFTPYVKLLSEKGLNIPFAILTDMDPQTNGKALGINRTTKLLKLLMENSEYQSKAETELMDVAAEYGIFINNYTFEIDFIKSGRSNSMCDTIIELSENGAAKTRASSWKKDPKTLDEKQFLKDIDEIGKGRFAQRYASNLKKNKGYKSKNCPAYIKGAIQYVKKKIGQ